MIELCNELCSLENNILLWGNQPTMVNLFHICDELCNFKIINYYVEIIPL